MTEKLAFKVGQKNKNLFLKMQFKKLIFAIFCHFFGPTLNASYSVI